jgi:hypothetical protein
MEKAELKSQVEIMIRRNKSEQGELFSSMMNINDKKWSRHI